jgi:hypothetical protein
MDGGKTWKKVFDSFSNYYFNEMTCYDEYNRIALGEGRKFYKYCITYRRWWESLEINQA